MGKDQSSTVAYEVSQPVAEDKLRYPTLPSEQSTPVKRYKLNQMHTLRGSPTNKILESLSATEHWLDIAKAPGAVPSPLFDAPAVSTTVKGSGIETTKEDLKEATIQLSPVQAAREELANAFREREAYRLKLNNGYSSSNASDFKDKAKAYIAKRYELIEHMPSGELNDEDGAKFPYLSPMDTGPPPVSVKISLYYPKSR